MANLKALRQRVASVKATRKITAAMKMVSAAKLRRARIRAENSRGYAQAMGQMVMRLQQTAPSSALPALLRPPDSPGAALLLLISSDRGLCGVFNSNLARAARAQLKLAEQAGQEMKIFCLGLKAAELLKREHARSMIETLSFPAAGDFSACAEISARIAGLVEAGSVGSLRLLYTSFRSAISQRVQLQSLVPLGPSLDADGGQSAAPGATAQDSAAPSRDHAYAFETEPEIEDLLSLLARRNLAAQIYRAVQESEASEHGARMTAMDNATRNAGSMIDRLTLLYNRSRQAAITNELIEIISAKEAM